MALLSSGSLTTQFGGGLTIRRSRPPTAAAELRALGTQMKLLKCTPTKGEDGENNYTNVVEMISDDPSELKSKATDLCRLIGVEPAPWCSRYPIMGDKEVQSNHEWIMELSNGISFAIEK